MRVLLDECLPRDLTKLLQGHHCKTTKEMCWDGKKNGELLRLAEQEFDVFLTVDRNLSRQQNISKFQITAVVLAARSNRIEDLVHLVPEILKALQRSRPGEVIGVGRS